MDRQAGWPSTRGPSRHRWVAIVLLLPLSGMATDRGSLIRETVAELDPLATSLSVDFGVDAEAGRAWAEITEHSGDAEAMPSIRQVDVTGLFFDVNESAVVIQKGGTRVVCAHQEISGGWLMRRETLAPTGDCQWKVEPREKTFDNGFSVVADRSVDLVLLGRARSSE